VVQIVAAAGSNKFLRFVKLCFVAHAQFNKIYEFGNTVITAQDPFEHGLVAALLAMIKNAPVEIQVHTDVASPYFKNENLLNQLRAWLAKIILSRATYIRVVSESLKKSLINGNFLQLPENKIKIIPIFVDTKKIQAAAPLNLEEFGHRLTAEKQVVQAARVIQKMKAQFPNIVLLISGDGPLKNELMKFSCVTLTGFVPNVESYMKGSDIYLLNSLYEGYGRTLKMASAAEVPIVSTPVGIAPEIITGENGILIAKIANDEALEQALMNALQRKTPWIFQEIIHAEAEDTITKQQSLWRECLNLQ